MFQKAKLIKESADAQKAAIDANWEAKDVPPSDEAFATAFSCFSSGVSDVSGHHPTGQEPDAAPGLSNELESATGGDAESTDSTKTDGLL